MSEVYYVYNSIAEFVETPFFTSSDAALYTILSACRFLITKITHYKLPFVNASYIYYSLAKVATKLEGYKTARSCYDKLAQLVVVPKWQEEIELGSLTIRSKPFSDKDTILPSCPRCSMANPLISDKNGCFNCKHPFIISFMSFEVLPLVEFKPAQGISHSKVIELVNSEKSSKPQKKGKDNWNQSIAQNQQVLSYEGNQSTNIFNPA
jgi:intraflagellar transport protein 122